MKKINLTLFLLLVSAFVALTPIATAQEAADKAQLSKTEFDVLQTYKEISSLPTNESMQERRAVFLKMSAQEKSEIFRLHLAMQLARRPNLSKEQMNGILEALSMLTPEMYGDNLDARSKAQQDGLVLHQKLLTLFSKREVYEIAGRLGGGADDVQLLQKYRDVISARSAAEKHELLKSESALNRADLWKLQMALYLAKHKELSDQQKNTICEAITALQPDSYELDQTTGNPKIHGFDAALNKRLQAVFSKEDAFKIFADFANQ